MSDATRTDAVPSPVGLHLAPIGATEADRERDYARELRLEYVFRLRAAREGDATAVAASVGRRNAILARRRAERSKGT